MENKTSKKRLDIIESNIKLINEALRKDFIFFYDDILQFKYISYDTETQCLLLNGIETVDLSKLTRSELIVFFNSFKVISPKVEFIKFKYIIHQFPPYFNNNLFGKDSLNASRIINAPNT